MDYSPQVKSAEKVRANGGGQDGLDSPRTGLRKAAFNCDQPKHSQFHKPRLKTTDHIAV